MTDMRERRLFEALYALTKAGEAAAKHVWPADIRENLRSALSEANKALDNGARNERDVQGISEPQADNHLSWHANYRLP